jgi:hypothetical protein
MIFESINSDQDKNFSSQHQQLPHHEMAGPTHGITDSSIIPQFGKDLKDLHLIYEYDAKDEKGNPEKWKYEM